MQEITNESKKHPTMADYWDGIAYFENFYNEPGWVGHRATEIMPVNGVWYRFERYKANDPVNYPSIEILGTNVCKSTDKGLTWSEPVKIIEPFGDNAWSRYCTDSGAYYDGQKWHILFQSMPLDPPGSPWCLSYMVCEQEDATAGTWYAPPGVVNPVIKNGDIWNTIAVGDNNLTKITGGEKRIFDEGTPKILLEDDGTIYITFHGASITKGTIFGYRGVATTKDFVIYTKAADDCIFSYLDAESWDVDWHSNGSVGGGAAAYIKDGEFWYTLIESPDVSLGIVKNQNWPFGLLRSNTLTNTEWEIWSQNPPPELTPVGPAFTPWSYPALFEDDGMTYMAITQSYPEHAYRQYRLVWKEGAEPLTAPSPKRRKIN